MNRKGLVSISFRGIPAEKVATSAKDAGLSWIEWGSDVHAPYNDSAKLANLAEFCKKTGIGICSYGSYFRLGSDSNSLLSDYISAAKLLGTDIIRIWCGQKGFANYSADERTMMIDAAKEAASIAAGENVTLCLECHNNTYTDCPEGAVEMMTAVNSKHFAMYWQPNQFRTVDENLTYADEIAKYTKIIHVFQWKGADRFPLSDGIEEWRDYLRRFDGSQKLLLEFMPDDRPESLQTEARSLDMIIGKENTK